MDRIDSASLRRINTYAVTVSELNAGDLMLKQDHTALVFAAWPAVLARICNGTTYRIFQDPVQRLASYRNWNTSGHPVPLIRLLSHGVVHPPNWARCISII